MLIVLAPWRATRCFTRVRLAGLFRKVAALFAAADAAVGPQTFENHFRGAGDGSRIFAVGDAEAADVLHQALDFRELLATFEGAGEFGQLQFSAQLEPLDDRLEVHFWEMFAEYAADGGANQFASDCVRAF